MGAFYAKFQVFFNSSICCSVIALLYASICHNFCFTKLLALIFISFLFWNFALFSLKDSDNVLMMKSYIRSVQ